MTDPKLFNELIRRQQSLQQMVSEIHVTLVGTKMNQEMGLLNEFKDFKEQVNADFKNVRDDISSLKDDKKAVKWLIRGISAALAFFGVANWPQVTQLIKNFLNK